MALALAPSQPALIPAQASSDAQLVRLWLDSQASIHTRAAYDRDAALFLQFVAGTPLQAVTVQDVLDWKATLGDVSDATRKRRLSAIKSLLTFGQRLGYLQYNAGAVLKLPKPKNTIAERILTVDDVERMIDGETDTRNRVLLIILYASGGRVSEICRLRWRDCRQAEPTRTRKRGQQERAVGGQLTLYGKGGKTRFIPLKPETYLALIGLRGEAGADDPVFRSREAGPLSRQQVWRIVRDAGVRAGIDADVSPHWMRHAHASHALDEGAPVHLVQATLGHASLDTTTVYVHAQPSDSSALYLPL